MAMTLTPDGRTVYVPDFLAPQAQEDPLALGTTLGPRGRGGPPPPQQIGEGVTPGAELAAPEVPSVTGGQLPTEAPSPPPAPQVQNAPDYLAGAVDNDPKVIAAKERAAAKAQAQADKAAKQQAAFAQTNEGKAQIAGEQAAQSVERQGDISRAEQYAAAAEMDEIANVEQQGLERSDEIRDQNARAQEEAKQAREAKQKLYDDAVATEANYKIDDNRRYKEMGTGRKVLYWMMAGLSGLGDALDRRRGPNMVIQMMQETLQNDVAAQVREREQLGKRANRAKDALDNYEKITGSLQEAGRLKLSEEYERIAQQVRVMSSKYGSEKAKLRGEAIAEKFLQDAAGIRAGAAESAYGRDMQRKQLAVSQGHLGLAYKQFDESKRQFNEKQKLDAAALDQASAAAAAKGNAEQAKLVRAQAIPGQAMSYKDPKTGELAVTQGVLMNKDGQPFIAPTEKEAIEIRAKTEQTANVVRVVDRIREIVSSGDVGKVGQWTASPEFKELQALKEQITVMRKNGEQGFSSDSDMARIEKMLGVNDLTSLRSSMKALDTGREQTIASLNTKLGKQGYDGPALTFADPLANKPGQTAADKTKGSVLIGQGQGWEGGADLRKRTIGGLLSKAIDLRLSPEERDAALAEIEQGAKHATSKDAKDAFQNALTQARVLRGQTKAPSTAGSRHEYK